jgi:hypothetical protein
MIDLMFFLLLVDGFFLCRLVRFYGDAVQVVDFYLCRRLFHLVLTYDSLLTLL